MPPERRNEYRSLSLETLEWMLGEVRKHHDDLLVMKTQHAIYSGAGGFIGGIISGVLVLLIARYVFHV